MTNPNAKRGGDFERKVKKEYESRNWYVMKSARSLGPADLVAIKKQRYLLNQNIIPNVHLIQCGKITSDKRVRLEKLAKVTGCQAVFKHIPPKRKRSPQNALRVKRHRRFKQMKARLI